jgi:hypothetical protein
MHVNHSLILKVSATIEGRVICSCIELFSIDAVSIMGFLFSWSKLGVTENAKIFVDNKRLFLFTFHTDVQLISCVVDDSQIIPTFWTWSHAIEFSWRFFWLGRFYQIFLWDKLFLTIDAYLVVWVVLKIASLAR